MDRKIIHIDMDAFFASVEQRDNPELKGKPIAVGGSKERGVVAAASYEARVFGVRSAMPSSQAFKRCPDIIFVKPRFEAYKEASNKIHEIFKRHTDIIEPLSLDEAYLDVTENKLGYRSASEIAQAIKHSINQELHLVASAGVSVNKFLAKIASDMDKPDGLYVIEAEEVDEFVNELEVAKIFGVGKVTAQKMYKLGIFLGKDLRRQSLETLERNFGSSGKHFYNISRGIDNRSVASSRTRKSVGGEQTFSKDLFSIPELTNVLTSLVDRVMKRYNPETPAKTLTVKVKYSDFNQITRSYTDEDGLVRGGQILAIGKELLMELPEDHDGIRLLGISLSNFKSAEDGPEQLRIKW